MTMKSEFLLPYYTAKDAARVGMFNTAVGKLQRELHNGEYEIFKHAPIFESDFIQITKRGDVIDVHNHVRTVTVGIVRTSPVLPLPDVMLLARSAPGCEELARRGQAAKGKSRKALKTLELTRLLPLRFVRISVHDREKQQLRLKFATGRSCYMQLCPPVEAREDLFAYWEKLIYLLRPPVESHSSTCAIPGEDTMSMPVLDEEDRMSLAVTHPQGKGDPDQDSMRSLHLVSDVHGVTSTAFAGGEGIPHDTHKSMPKSKSAELAQELGTGPTSEATTTGGIAGTLSVTATKSADSGQVSAAIAGAAAMGAGESRNHVAIAGTVKMSPQSVKIAFAGAVSKSKENAYAATSLSSEDSAKAARASVGPLSPSVGETDPLATPVSTLSSGSFLGGEAEQQRVSRTSAGAPKETRERREQREKDSAVGRSSHHPGAGEGHHQRGGQKMSQKSPGHRATASSGSTGKRLGRISSFLRTIRGNFAAKGLASQPVRDADLMAKTVEKTNMDAIMETGENN